MEGKNQLGQKFHLSSLLKFTAPTVIMLIFMSLYQMVDGVFVSNIVGENALSALNVVYPVPSVLIAISIMLATGGSAIIAKNMGEGKEKEARENFSFLIATGAILGIALMILGVIFIEPLIHLLGATPLLYEYCHDYLLILMLSAPLAIFQMLFQSFFVTAGKPQLGLSLTVMGGVLNIVLDYVFMKIFHMGVAGAAIATSIGYAIPAIGGLLYFGFCRKGSLYLVKLVWRRGLLWRCSFNGSSEMVNNLAVAITTYLFNILMLRYAGEVGVAAITIVLYAQFFMTSAFMGFSSGVAPIISFKYGSDDQEQLKSIFRNSLLIILAVSVFVFLVAFCFGEPLILIFTPRGSEVFEVAKHGFLIFSFSFLFTGVNIFSSAMFTAFSNGLISGILSLLRTFVFLVASLLLLPMLLETDGIWLAVPVAELLALFVSIYYLYKYRKIYHYQ